MDDLKEAKVDEIIKSLESGFGTGDDSQAKTLQLLKGIIFSDDPKAVEYVKKLDAATTKISKEMSEAVEPVEANKIKVEKAFKIPGTDIQLKEGQTVTILSEAPVDPRRVDASGSVEVAPSEEKRLASLGVDIPPMGKSGPITYQGKEVGHANNFSGVVFTDKDFIKQHVQDVLYYTN